MKSQVNRRSRAYLALLTAMAFCLALSTLVYLPGLSGPFVFDDFSNVVNNTFIQIQSLDSKSLYHAAFSIQSGPLLRPVAMLSFALNYYFAGSFADTTPFKLTNIAIHAINAMLVFWLLRLVLERNARISSVRRRSLSARSQLILLLLAGATALLWTVHPIQLTSVLYVVQRMVGLSALFTLLGLISYLKGRERQLAGKNGGYWLMFASPLGLGTLGILSKENAVLLPGFIAVIEFTLFAGEKPWRSWKRLPANYRYVFLGIIVITLIAALAFAISYAQPGYAVRDFTMAQRVMTESRVLFFYLSLILLPRISQFSLHQEIVVSTSLLTPWTTLASLLGLLALLAASIVLRKRFPLLSLGILWYFVAHSLESTIFNLELVHEHRNYLASLGILLAFVHIIEIVGKQFSARLPWVLLPMLALAFAGTTLLRSNHWSSFHALAVHEATYRPNSASAQADLGFALADLRQPEAAIQAMRRAAELSPEEPSYLINMHLLAAHMKIALTPEDNQEVLRRLALRNYMTASTSQAIQNVNTCLLAKCQTLAPQAEQWLRTKMNASRPSANRSFYFYVLGRALFAQGKTNEAIEALVESSRQDPDYLHPLFELVQIYLRLGLVDAAEGVLAQLRRANEGNIHPRDREINILIDTIARLKKARQ